MFDNLILAFLNLALLSCLNLLTIYSCIPTLTDKIAYIIWMNKYLIRIWFGDSLIKDLQWESDDEEDLLKTVSESIPKEVRVTVENVERGNAKARWYS